VSKIRPLGVLVLVVGPSGVGKDTLINGAREALGSDSRFTFVRRIVTRPADAELEDHDSIDPVTFSAMQASGRFALSWDAHNLRYALPISVDTDLALGRIVVANVSRHVISTARAKYPHSVVVLISAEISERAARLRRRGRENPDQISSRLARESAPVPAGVTPVVIDNSGSVAIGIATFVMALRSIANTD
jgi:ribose 1,5-bisphosphokinase